MSDADLKFIADFRAWMSDNDLAIEAASGLCLVNSADADEGRCILASADYLPNTHIYTIPSRFLINHRHALKQPQLLEFFEWSARNSADYQLTRLDALYLHLLAQRATPGSELHGYVKSMPEEYDTPEYWDQGLVEALPSYLKTSALARIEKQTLKLAKIRAALERFVSAENKGDCAYFMTLLDSLTADSFRWVFNSVNSRCFYLDDTEVVGPEELSVADRLFGPLTKRTKQKTGGFKEFLADLEADEEVNNNMCCLIPFVDMLNHSLEPNGEGTHWSLRSYLANKRFFLCYRVYQL